MVILRGKDSKRKGNPLDNYAGNVNNSYYQGNNGGVGYDMPYARRPRRMRRGCSCLVTLISIVVLVAVIIGFISLFTGPLFPPGPTTVAVTAHPTLIIDDQVYVEKYQDHPLIHVHTGNATQAITIQRQGSWLNAFIPVSYDRSPDRGTVILVMNGSSHDSFDITVPVTTDLKIDANSADIAVTGVTGQMVLSSNSGNITVDHSNVQNSSLLANNDGDLTMKQTTASGEILFRNNQGAVALGGDDFHGNQTTVSNNQGTISMLQNIVGGQVTIQSNTGSTTFDNTIRPAGNYQFISNGGTIDCALPSNTPLHIDAIALNSTVSADFPGIQVQNHEVHSDVGAAGSLHPTIQLHNTNGQIKLHTSKYGKGA